MNGWEWGKKMAVATRENIERQKDLDDDERIAEKVRVIMAILEDSKKHDSPLDAVRLIVNTIGYSILELPPGCDTDPLLALIGQRLKEYHTGQSQD